MRIEDDVKLDFTDVLIKPKRSTLTSRKDVSLTRQFSFRHSPSTGVITPLIAANMDGVGTVEMAKVLGSYGILTALTKHYDIDTLVNTFRGLTANSQFLNETTIYSMGISVADILKYDAVCTQLAAADVAIRYVCVDVANGYSEAFSSFVKKFREKNPCVTIIAGNVVTPEMTEELILNGADIVKVGIGPGSVCTTRKMTGVGYPQLSAVIECADAAHGLGGHIISDGGCTVPGDVSKAFGAGADFVMLGGMLAGSDEGGGKIVDGRVQFYGMSSAEAMGKHNGGVAEYRASEGKVVDIPYRGPIADTIKEILGGVRSTCTYVGASNIKDLPKRTTFIRVNNQINDVFGRSK